MPLYLTGLEQPWFGNNTINKEVWGGKEVEFFFLIRNVNC